MSPKKAIPLTLLALFLAISVKAPQPEQSHNLSEIHPIDTEFNMSNKSIYNISELRLETGFEFNNLAIEDNGDVDILRWDTTNNEWELPSSGTTTNLNINGNKIRGFFASSCPSGQVIQKIKNTGNYKCVAVSNEVTDKWLNETGDTVRGVLVLNNNSLSDVGSPSDPFDAVNKQYVDTNDDTTPDNQDLSQVLSLGNSTGSYDIDLNGNAIETGGGTITLYDTANSQDIARFKEGGGVQIPNGNLNLSFNNLVGVGGTQCGPDEALLGDGTCGSTGSGGGGGGVDYTKVLNRSGDTMAGDLDLAGNNITDSGKGNVTIAQDLKVYGDIWYVNDSAGSSSSGEQGSANLSEILSNGNSAGSYNINMNGNKITRSGNITVSGNMGITGGDVGLGTSIPDRRLHVKGSIKLSSNILGSSGLNIAGGFGNRLSLTPRGGGGAFQLRDNSAEGNYVIDYPTGGDIEIKPVGKVLINDSSLDLRANNITNVKRIGVNVSKPDSAVEVRNNQGLSGGKKVLAEFERLEKGSGNAGLNINYHAEAGVVNYTQLYFPGDSRKVRLTHFSGGSAKDLLRFDSNQNVAIPNGNISIGDAGDIVKTQAGSGHSGVNIDFRASDNVLDFEHYKDPSQDFLSIKYNSGNGGVVLHRGKLNMSGNDISEIDEVGGKRRKASMDSIWHDSFEDNSLDNWAITTQNNGGATGIGSGGQAGTKPIGDYLINMEGSDVLTYQSNIDLAGIDQPVISFYWTCRSCDGEGGYLYVSKDGGSSWTQERRLRPIGGSGDSDMQYEEVELTGYGNNGDVRIRFEGSPGPKDDFAVDNINIRGQEGFSITSSTKAGADEVATITTNNDVEVNGGFQLPVGSDAW